MSESLPAIESRAWVCLEGGPDATWDGCAEPPPLPPSVRLQQVVGEVRVRRTLFGVEAYSMDLGGDGIVDMESQWAGGTSFMPVSCTVDAGDLIGLNPFKPVILLMEDNTTLDNIFEAALWPRTRRLRWSPWSRSCWGCSERAAPTSALRRTTTR